MHGLHHCCALEPPVLECPPPPEVMPRRAGQPQRARHAGKRAKFYRDESRTERGRAAERVRTREEVRLEEDECSGKLRVLLLHGAEYHCAEWEHMGIAVCCQQAN